MRYLILFFLVISFKVSAQYADQKADTYVYPIEEDLLEKASVVQVNPFDYTVETNYYLLPDDIKKSLKKMSMKSIDKILEVQPNEYINRITYMIYTKNQGVVQKFQFDKCGNLINEKSFDQPANKGVIVSKVANKDQIDLY